MRVNSRIRGFTNLCVCLCAHVSVHMQKAYEHLSFHVSVHTCFCVHVRTVQ